MRTSFRIQKVFKKREERPSVSRPPAIPAAKNLLPSRCRSSRPIGCFTNVHLLKKIPPFARFLAQPTFVNHFQLVFHTPPFSFERRESVVFVQFASFTGARAPFVPPPASSSTRTCLHISSQINIEKNLNCGPVRRPIVYLAPFRHRTAFPPNIVRALPTTHPPFV